MADVKKVDYDRALNQPLSLLLIMVAKDNMLEMRRIVLEASPDQRDNMACLRALVAAFPTVFANSRCSTLSDLVWYIIEEHGPPIVNELHDLLPNCLSIAVRHRGTMLHLCVKDSTVDVVKAILRVEPQLASTRCELDDCLALHYCSSVDMVGPLVEAYPESVNCRDKYGSTPLHYATKRLDVDVVDALLKHGAHTNIRNVYKNTPADLASCQVPTDASRAIIEMLEDSSLTKRAV